MMKYNKPEVVVLADAASVIRGTLLGKPRGLVIEGHEFGTPAAYESDE
jgi:hypothetical protein